MNLPPDMFQRVCALGDGWLVMDAEIRARLGIPRDRFYSIILPPGPAGR